MRASDANLDIIPYTQFHQDLVKAKIQQSNNLVDINPIKTNSHKNVAPTSVLVIYSIIVVSIFLLSAHGHRLKFINCTFVADSCSFHCVTIRNESSIIK